MQPALTNSSDRLVDVTLSHQVKECVLCAKN